MNSEVEFYMTKKMCDCKSDVSEGFVFFVHIIVLSSKLTT